MNDLYNDNLDANDQIDTEEQIASIIRDADDGDGPLYDEELAEMGRQILKLVLKRFRPDLFEE